MHLQNFISSIFSILLPALFGVLASAAVAEPPDTVDGASKVEFRPMSIAAFSEFGSLQSGRYGNSPRFRDEWVDHFGAFMTQRAVLGDHLAFNIGLGGIFEFQKREVISPEWGGSQYKSFFMGPTIADLEYLRKAPGGSSWGLAVGLFPYKYNPDAFNLGEYLFRSGAYPTYILGGGYAFVGDAQVYLQGMKGTFRAGGFSADLLATMETSIPPLYDISLAAVLKYQGADGLFEVMGGANAKRLFPVHPSRTRLQSPINAWFEKGNATYTGRPAYYSERGNFYSARSDEAGKAGQAEQARQFDSLAVYWKAQGDSVRAWTRKADAEGVPLPQPAYQYYTSAGLLLMAGFALDPKAILPAWKFGPQDLRLYAEASLLGVRNYPIFYEKPRERMPVMLGFNVPTFGLLDLCAVQVEHFASPYMNSYFELGTSNAALPSLPEGKDGDRSELAYNDIAAQDDWSWTFLLRKEVVRGMTLSAQVARDHIRSVSVDSWFGPGLEPTEILGKEKDWYWMVQFGFGI